MKIDDAEKLLIGLNESIRDARALISEAMSTVNQAREISEHARAVSESNEAIFRSIMANARAQASTCDDHRRRIVSLEAKLERIEATSA